MDRFLAEGGRGVGVLVLSGSSGQVEEARCRVLASAGATALSVRWFGGPGQRPAVDLVPLETFDEPLRELRSRCDRVVVLGTSCGAEAALLLAAQQPWIDAVIAISPSDVVWAALSGVRPQRSSWTVAGRPLPFVPYDDAWQPGPDLPPSYVASYRHSLATDAKAGHRVVLPGEQPPPARTDLAHGGTPEAAAALGRLAWPVILEMLGLLTLDSRRSRLGEPGPSRSR